MTSLEIFYILLLSIAVLTSGNEENAASRVTIEIPYSHIILPNGEVDTIKKDYRSYVGPSDEYDIMGATQFNLLTSLGLRENHTLLDFGCGSLRAGRLFITYLTKSRYSSSFFLSHSLCLSLFLSLSLTHTCICTNWYYLLLRATA
jgi:hypothetical protein